MKTPNHILLGFVATTFALSWIAIPLLGLAAPNGEGAQPPIAWIATAFVYLGTLGWQPAVALFLL